MKKFSVLLGLFLLSCFVTKAQRSELMNVKNEFAKFQEFKQQGYYTEQMEALKKAQLSADKAVLNERTRENAQLWSYRAMIYISLVLLDTADATTVKKNTQIAEISVRNARKFDYSASEQVNIQTAERNMAVIMQDRGIVYYKNKDYTSAYEAFKFNAEVLPQDTTFNFYAALSAKALGKIEDAIKHYAVALQNGMKNADLFAEYSRACLLKKDTVTAMDLLYQGIKYNPSALSLLYEEANLYIARGKIDELLGTLEEASRRDENNKMLIFVYGVAAERSNKKQEAEQAYKKALSLDANYFEANFNLGALYVNQANEILQQANALPESKQSQYLIMKKQFLQKLSDAVPYLEKAHTLNAKDKSTLVTLQEIYARTNQIEKAKKTKEKLEKL